MLFLQVLLAVHHVHSRHMIHRDIKSANILLCSNGLVKLGDFGFSRMYAATVSDDVGRTFCGTPYYVAPEIWRRRPYSKKADMFSLGVLLYELLTLKRPFDGANMNEVMQKTLAGRFEPLPSKISPEMKEIVSSLLSGDPTRRPSSSKLLNTAICKLFMSGLLEIVQSQQAFQGKLRSTITDQIQQTKAVLRSETHKVANPMEDSRTGAAASTTTILEGAQPLSSNIGGLTVYEGIVKKQSSGMVWKRRYLCIRAELADGQTATDNPNPKFKSLDLVLAVSKDTMEQQCIATPFYELEDVFPVPPRYTGSNASHVFAVAFKTGKRLLFQARGDAECSEWMEKIQEVLGIGDE
ncbi:protein kinase [Angomonas deanei]|uniref:non-specific serine/threonine protein kinase n=1 Tax=Angomonas deanei TaxID=59799 RepID=A0A7G2C643_9TRYP|nr:protein kinase [Angomonas deanei]CAD2214253.1 Protein kinase domain/Protein tyrosine kinase/PH domain containing protein, putative [Angomonas deanei]|eukprot:EPY26300.1 protein kinase [Angomonas deanei]